MIDFELFAKIKNYHEQKGLAQRGFPWKRPVMPLMSFRA